MASLEWHLEVGTQKTFCPLELALQELKGLTRARYIT